MATLQGLLQSQAYTYLRNKKQLGYAVLAQFRPMGCVDGAMILVQGSDVSPYEVNAQIEYFLEGFEKQLNKMTDKFFVNLKQGAVVNEFEFDRSHLSAMNQSPFSMKARTFGPTLAEVTLHLKNGKLLPPQSRSLPSMIS
jgi:secreted Zn-dependent insulinase-like peptidase